MKVSADSLVRRITLLSVLTVGWLASASAGHADEAKHQIHPIILIHGSGPRKMPVTTVSMATLADLLAERGFPRAHTFLPVYPQGGDLAASVQAVQSAIRRISATYPAGTTFDVITHSMGHIVGLMAILESNFTSHVRNFIGLAGVAHGQDRRNKGCLLLGGCGNLFTLLRPAYEGWIGSYLAKFDGPIASMQKCSLFSPDDGVLDPYDSGAFSDGTNVELSGVRHLQFIRTRSVVQSMLTHCQLAP